jgi:hypothetical protein
MEAPPLRSAPRCRPGAAFGLAVGLAVGLASGCAGSPPEETADHAARDRYVYLRAEAERARLLEREVARLRGDLVEAEQALLAAESGLLGAQTRADAVSAAAAARVELERARKSAPWHEAALDEARAKLDEAERQIEAGHFGTACFLASRAERIASQAAEEAQAAGGEPGARRISASRANLREGPSLEGRVLTVLVRGTPVFPERTEAEWMLVRTGRGHVGWVHASLVQ